MNLIFFPTNYKLSNNKKLTYSYKIINKTTPNSTDDQYKVLRMEIVVQSWGFFPIDMT